MIQLFMLMLGLGLAIGAILEEKNERTKVALGIVGQIWIVGSIIYGAIK